MPIRTKFNATDGIVFHVATGDVSAQEIVSAFDYVTVLPRYGEGMHAVWDFSRASFDGMTHEDVAWIQQETTRLRPSWGPDFRTAFVYGRDTELELLTLFKKMAAHHPVTYRIFESLEEATGWIRGETE